MARSFLHYASVGSHHLKVLWESRKMFALVLSCSADGQELATQRLMAECYSDVRYVGTGDLITCWPFLAMVRPKPVVFSLYNKAHKVRSLVSCCTFV